MFRITLILNNLLFEEPVVSTGSSIYRKIPLPTDGRYTRKKSQTEMKSSWLKTKTRHWLEISNSSLFQFHIAGQIIYYNYSV